MHVCARVPEGNVRVCTSTTPTGKEIWKARVPEGRVPVGTKGVRVCTSTTPAFPKAEGKARVRVREGTRRRVREGTGKGEGKYG